MESSRETALPLLPYAMSRRRLGICYVGTIVTLCLIGLSTGVIVNLFGQSDNLLRSWFFNIVKFIVCFTVFSLPFDLAGFAIERRYHRTEQSLAKYLQIWSKAAFKHAFLFLSVAVFLTFINRLFGLAGVLLGTSTLSLLLIARQTEIARFYSGLLFEEPSQFLRADFPQNRDGSSPLIIALTEERCFSGGIVGLPGAEAIVIPRFWLNTFSKQELWAEITRRNAAIASGAHRRGIVLAVVFTNLGALVAYLLTTQVSHLAVASSSGLISMSCWFTLWSFIGLLTLPYFSRNAVYEVDRLAIERSVSEDLLWQSVTKIDKYLEDEATRSLSVDTIFHPIPTVTRRMAQLKNLNLKRVSAWHAARYSVMLSILGLGLLGRAVHCNAGKPELWALLPAD